MFDILINSLFVFVQVFIICFTVPYISGSSLQSLSKNYIWRLVYYTISSIGTFIYRCVEAVFNVIVGTLVKIIFNDNKTILTLLNLILYFAIIYIANLINSASVNSIFNIEGFDVDFGDSIKEHSIYSNLSSILIFIKYMFEAESLDGFFIRLEENIISLLYFIVYSTVFYSIIFGILENKVKELHLLGFLNEGGPDSYNREYGNILLNLIHNIVNDIKKFIDDICLMRHFYNIKVLFIFLIGCVVYSVLIYKYGDSYSSSDLIFMLMEEVGIFDTIIRFTLVLLFNIIFQMLLILLYRISGEPFRDTIDEIDIQAGQLYNRWMEDRYIWASEHDCLGDTFDYFNGLGNEFTHSESSRHIDFMNLDD